MTQNKRELLLKDLCARLPYGVICHYDTIVPIIGKVKSYDKLRAISEFDNKPCFQFGSNRDIFDFDNVRPYLFPLSSMTEEQKQEYTYIVNYISPDDTDTWKEGEFIYVEQFTQLMHFYHINHMDYMGLIPKGLAIDATGLNIY